jgi:hypothetical protein
MAAKVLKNLSYLNKFAQKLRDYRLNMYAKEVRTPQYKQRVIKNKKVYSRKNFKNEFDT